ncbi:MAG TPA: twin-arginine translocase TatA/TatE family subunit [Candidatus Binatia bacterium]|jgi:sec-independent protein translocase protein TatA|nr:twin-arginine translocase TatA/TatE family subunit [Candidatus Binatia bacterium]
MFGLGIGELLIILVIVVVLFSRRLPDLGESFGAAIRKFRKAVKEPDEIDITPKQNSGRNDPKK